MATAKWQIFLRDTEMNVYIYVRYLSLCVCVSISTCTCHSSVEANKLKVCMSKEKRLGLKTLDLISVVSSPVLKSQGFFKITSIFIIVIASGKIENSQQKCKGDFEWITILWLEIYQCFVSAHYPFQFLQLLCYLQSKTEISNSLSSNEDQPLDFWKNLSCPSLYKYRFQSTIAHDLLNIGIKSEIITAQ